MLRWSQTANLSCLLSPISALLLHAYETNTPTSSWADLWADLGAELGVTAKPSEARPWRQQQAGFKSRTVKSKSGIFQFPWARFQRGSLNARAVCRGQLAHADSSALTMICACVLCMFTYVVCNSRIVFTASLIKSVLHGQWWRKKLFLEERCGRKQREIGLRMSVLFTLAA